MTIHSMNKTTRGRALPVSTLVLLLALGACNTNKVEIPELSGPSELALSLNLTASPDVLVADGASTSAIQATIRDHNGRPVPGQAVFFSVTDAAGNFADIGELNAPSAVSGPSGTAQVIYRAPARTDATANQLMRVVARPISTDALGQIYRTVNIELRSAEGRLFPEVDGNTEPTCDFAIQAPFGFLTDRSILFQSTASDPDAGGFIVRYFWTFGDDSPPQDKPDVEHHYRTAGPYDVTHIVTDNNGGQSTCTKTITIVG
jgi:hypothetical protein